MPYVVTNGVRTFYDIAGEGPPMLLLHCNPFDRRTWMHQVAWFSQWFRVATPDLRGYGLTDKVTDPYTLDDVAADILGVIEAERMTDIVLGGVRIGAVMAMKLGAERADLFRALILVGASAPAKDRGPNDPRVRDYRERGVAGWRPHMEVTVSKSFAESPQGRHALDMFEANALHMQAEGIVKMLQARGPVDLVPILPKIAQPTLVVNGEFDNALTEGRRAARLIPNAEHMMLPGAGHACCLEDPVGFDAAMTDFLVRNRLMPPLKA